MGKQAAGQAVLENDWNDMVICQEGNMGCPSDHAVQVHLADVEVNLEPVNALELGFLLLSDSEQVVHHFLLDEPQILLLAVHQPAPGCVLARHSLGLFVQLDAG